MGLNIVSLPNEYFPFFDKSGPIWNAQIFIGEPDLDPEIPANQKTVTLRQESGDTVDVPQPIRTSSGGIPTYNGSPAQILVDGNYSIKVLDNQGNQIYYYANFFNGTPITTGTLSSVLAPYIVYAFNTEQEMIDNDNDITYEVGTRLKVQGENDEFINYTVVNFSSDVNLGGGLWAKELNAKDRNLRTFTSLDELGIDDSFFTPNSTIQERQDRLNDLALLMGDNSMLQLRATSSSAWDNFRACTPVPNRQGMFLLHNKTSAYWECKYTVVTTTTSDSLRSFYWGKTQSSDDDWREYFHDVGDNDLKGTMWLTGSAATRGRFRKNDTPTRDEIQLYSSEVAFGTGSKGCGLHLYGNSDFEHAGNFTVITGQDDEGTARLIVSGGSNDPASEGYRTNTDTRVTIGNSIWDFVDNQMDSALLTLKNPIGRPAIYVTDTSSSEGELAVPHGEAISFGHWSGTTFTERMTMTSLGNWTPAVNGVGDIGSTTARWDVIRAITGTIDTSDSNTKSYQNPLSEKEKIVARKLIGLVRTYKLNSSIESKGEEARIHTGLIAQEVKAAFESEGLFAEDYAILCLDEWEAQYKNVVVNKGELIDKVVEVQKTKDVPTTTYENKLINGKWTRVKVEGVKKEPLFTTEILYDEEGNEIDTINIPVMETKVIRQDADPVIENQLVKEAGSQYGLRYTELLCFIIGAL